jgi:hypothetical protein
MGVKLSGALPLSWGWVVCLETTGVIGLLVRVGTGEGWTGVATGVAGPSGAGGGPSAGRHCGMVPAADGADGALVAGRAGTGVTVA